MVGLVLLTFTIPALVFAERKGRLVGKLIDDQGTPIQGVAVTVTSPQIPTFREITSTDKKGVFTVNFREINVTYVYRFEKVGYQTTQAQQLWSLEGTQLFEWTMPPAPVAPQGAIPASASEPAVQAYNNGIAALKAKDLTSAEAQFLEAVKQDPNLRQGWVALSGVQVELGHNKEGAESAEKAIAMGATDEAVLLARWQAYRNLKDEVKAAEALKALETIGRRTEEAKKLHNEGVALTKAGDHAGAFAKFKEAINLDPNLQVSQLGLATAALKIGRNAEAADAAEAVLQADPRNEKAIRLRFNACLALADKARLLDALVGLAAVEPLIARDGILRLAFEAYDANDTPVAKERFEKALQLDPNYPQAYYYLGLICVSQNASAEARSNFERFLQLAPNDPEAASARDALKYLKP